MSPCVSYLLGTRSLKQGSGMCCAHNDEAKVTVGDHSKQHVEQAASSKQQGEQV